MQELTQERIQIAYLGPATQGGRMSMLAVSNALRGQALLIERVSALLVGETIPIQVEIDPNFEAGSLVIPVHIFSDAYHTGTHLLASEGFTATANLLAILGFLGVDRTSIYKLFKRLRGRPIDEPTAVPVQTNINLSVDTLVRIYNDSEVQTQLRKILDPLRHEGVDTFETRNQGKVMDSVAKADLVAADEADEEQLTSDEEVELGIEKVAWRKNLAWHLSDGKKSFDARIDDEEFWKRLSEGEAFADGDTLRVHLRTRAIRLPNGSLKVERRIPKVISVGHARQRIQADFFRE